jgi:glyoxylase-like metal-dependent hydrolase (beta-lactamase superfamily II)
MTIRDGSRKSVKFPSSVAVIDHPTEGVVLFDTGYSRWFYEATRRLPNKIYAWITPVVCAEEESAAQKLAAMGIGARDVRTLVLSHFHADHIAGLRDFPHARFVHNQEAWDAVKSRRGLRAVTAGFLPELVPADYEARARGLTAADFSVPLQRLGFFSRGADLFGDGSVIAVELPGHVRGHMGLLVNDEYFLIGDAAWSRRAVEENVLPHPAALHLLANTDARGYKSTLAGLHELSRARSDLRIVPCHCASTLRELPPLERARPPAHAS